MTYISSSIPKLWANALEVGTASITKYGGAEEGMRTLLDALYPASKALVGGTATMSTTDDCGGAAIKLLVVTATEAAREGMEKTKSMVSLAGRSNYIASEAMQGIPDPGAFAVFSAFEAIVAGDGTLF